MNEHNKNNDSRIVKVSGAIALFGLLGVWLLRFLVESYPSNSEIIGIIVGIPLGLILCWYLNNYFQNNNKDSINPRPTNLWLQQLSVIMGVVGAYLIQMWLGLDFAAWLSGLATSIVPITLIYLIFRPKNIE